MKLQLPRQHVLKIQFVDRPSSPVPLAPSVAAAPTAAEVASTLATTSATSSFSTVSPSTMSSATVSVPSSLPAVPTHLSKPSPSMLIASQTSSNVSRGGWSNGVARDELLARLLHSGDADVSGQPVAHKARSVRFLEPKKPWNAHREPTATAARPVVSSSLSPSQARRRVKLSTPLRRISTALHRLISNKKRQQ